MSGQVTDDVVQEHYCLFALKDLDDLRMKKVPPTPSLLKDNNFYYYSMLFLKQSSWVIHARLLDMWWLTLVSVLQNGKFREVRGVEVRGVSY